MLRVIMKNIFVYLIIYGIKKSNYIRPSDLKIGGE